MRNDRPEERPFLREGIGGDSRPQPQACSMGGSDRGTLTGRLAGSRQVCVRPVCGWFLGCEAVAIPGGVSAGLCLPSVWLVSGL